MKHFVLATALSFLPFTVICQHSVKEEVLTVEVFGPIQWQGAKHHGVFLHWADRESEKIDFGPCNHPEDCILRYGPIVRNKFQDLIKNGWELKSSAGGDSFIRYVFTRLKE